MMYAKITPNAVIVRQTTPFEHVSEIAEYMRIIVLSYIPGAEKTKFIIEFGNLTTADINEPALPFFMSLYAMEIELTLNEIESWGTDDKTLYDILANKLNIEIISYA
jgi:hypothetical protein